LEFIGYPISRSFTTYCVCLELRSLPSTGITRLQRYYEPLRHPEWPGLSLAGVRLAGHAQPPLGASRVASISLCMRAAANTPVEPLGACFAHFPSDNSLPRCDVGVGFHITLFGACSAFTTRCNPHARRVTKVTLYTEGFSRFVTSTTAPIATGWSESYRVGLSPTGKSRLSTAHVAHGSCVTSIAGPNGGMQLYER